MKWHAWLAIAILTATLLAIDVVGGGSWFPAGSDGWRWVFVMMMGVCVAQVNLIAIWAALAPGRVILRLPWSIFLATLMWYALLLGNRWQWPGRYGVFSYRSPIDLGDAVLLGIVILVGVFSVQVPLWAASRLFAWRLVPPTTLTASRDHERQFNLKHLIAGMLLASVALGLGRIILPADELRWVELDRDFTVILPAMLIVNLVAIVPCIWISFASWPRLVPLVIGWLVYVVVVSLAEIGILVAILGPPPDDVWLLFTLFNLAQGICVLAVLSVLRLVGFRLVRWRSAEKSPLATVTPPLALDIMQPPTPAVEAAVTPVESPP